MDLRALLPLDPHGLVSRSAAVAAGLDDADLGRLRREQRIVLVRRGVYVDATVWQDAEPFRARPLCCASAPLSARCAASTS